MKADYEAAAGELGLVGSFSLTLRDRCVRLRSVAGAAWAGSVKVSVILECVLTLCFVWFAGSPVCCVVTAGREKDEAFEHQGFKGEGDWVIMGGLRLVPLIHTGWMRCLGHKGRVVVNGWVYNG